MPIRCKVPECGKPCKNQAGLGMHMAKSHPNLNPETLELKQRESQATSTELALHQSDQITPELVAYGVGQVEIILSGIANKNDVPAQQYARRVFEHFLHTPVR